MKAIFQGKFWQAFKTFAILFSFTVNVILLLVLLLAAPLILPIVGTIVTPLVGGLNDSFVQMGEATITRTIEVNDNIPVVFELPVSTATTVVLLSPVPLSIPAQFVLPAGGGYINGTVSINLPAGLQLPVALDITVPVSQTVPVNLLVDVSIPLDETELGAPFMQLQQLFAPLDSFISALPGDNEELIERIRQAMLPASTAPTPEPVTTIPD